jgi:hypothetical protein
LFYLRNRGKRPSIEYRGILDCQEGFFQTAEEKANPEIASDSQSVHDACMPEKSILERVDDCEKIQGNLQTDLEKQSGRLRELEADVKDLVMLFKHLVASSPQGEQLLFMSLARIELQDEAVAKFDEKLREISTRKALS